jgi:hypothetical protein
MKSCLLGYNGVYYDEIQRTFLVNISPPSSGSKNKVRKEIIMKHAANYTAL